jgi:hypothetical protein
MKILGTGTLIMVFVVSPYFLFVQNLEIPKVVAFATIGVLCGLGLLLAERITSVKMLGTEIKATTEKAHLDAQQIEEMLKDVQAQKEIIDLIVRDANIVQTRVAEVEGISQEVRLKAEQIEFTAQEARSKAKKAEEDITKIVKTFDDRVGKKLLEMLEYITRNS